MKIGVISDTHGRLPGAVFEAFAGVERIIHCGDFGDEGILDDLETIAPVTAVQGNTDYPLADDRAPDMRVVEIEGATIAIAHGHQAPGIYTNRQGLVDLFQPFAPRIICYGHTHVFAQEWFAGILALNPGAIFDPRGGKGPTVALLNLQKDQPVQAEEVRLNRLIPF